MTVYRAPIFMIHGLSGRVESFVPMAEKLKEKLPGHPLFYITLPDSETTSVEEACDQSITQIRPKLESAQQPCFLIGHSKGAVIAAAIARKLDNIALAVFVSGPFSNGSPLANMPFIHEKVTQSIGQGSTYLKELDQWFRESLQIDCPQETFQKPPTDEEKGRAILQMADTLLKNNALGLGTFFQHVGLNIFYFQKYDDYFDNKTIEQVAAPQELITFQRKYLFIANEADEMVSKEAALPKFARLGNSDRVNIYTYPGPRNHAHMLTAQRIHEAIIGFIETHR